MESTGYEGLINFIRNEDNRKVVEWAKLVVGIAKMTDEQAKADIDNYYSEFGFYMAGRIEAEKIFDRIHDVLKTI